MKSPNSSSDYYNDFHYGISIEPKVPENIGSWYCVKRETDGEIVAYFNSNLYTISQVAKMIMNGLDD